MFNGKDIEAGFFIVTLLGSLIFAWPVIETYMPSIPGDKYTELFLLGPTHEAENYPNEIHAGEQYRLYLNVVNHRAALSYYKLQIKIRSIIEPPPNPIEGIESNLAAITELPIILSPEGKWEEAITLTFPEIRQVNDTILIPNANIGSNIFYLNKTLSGENETGIGLGLFFELWLLDEATSEFHFDNRFVELWLNVIPTK